MEVREYRLGDVCTLRAGSAFKKKYQGLRDGDLPFIKVSDMNLPSNQFRILEANNWVSLETANEIGAKPFPADTVVFAKIGEALKQNRVRLLTVPTLIDNNMMGAIPNLDVVQPRYLLLVLATTGLDRWATGTAMPYLTQGTLNGVPIELPDMQTQRKTASVLAAYDELIENNLRRIEILEEMAQEVYREWFVNFRFPGHEDVALVDSPFGPIPEGWEMQRLDEIAALHRGRSYRTANLVDDGGWPFLNLKCIDRDGGFRRSGLKRYEGPIKPHQLARTGDIVVALTDMTQERRIVARAARVPKLHESEAAMSMDLLRVEPVDRNDKSFVYGTLRFSSFPDQVKQYANGANVLHLSPDRIAEFELPIPPRDHRQRFAEVVEPLVGLSDNLELQNENLRATRDLLLPRLVSGEIDVSDLDIDTEWLAS